MEVKAGYKQTEVGVIPKDWDVYTLGEIGKFKNGINKGSDAFGQGTPFVNLMDIFGVNSLASVENLGLITCSNFERGIYNLKQGDVIFVRSSVKPSGVGLTAVIDKDLPDTVYSGFLIRFRDGGKLDTGFKRYCFYEERFRNSVIGSSTVSANTNINQDSLKRLYIPLPPTKAEQKAIAESLSDVDALIEALEQLIAKKRQVKQGAMQELLTGKRRLPGFEKAYGHKQTEVGIIPQDWVVTKISDVAEKITVGFVGSMAHLFTSQGVPLLRGQNVLPNKIDLAETLFISSETHKKWRKSALQAGDVVMVRVGYPGTSCVIPEGLGEANAASLVIVRPLAKRLSVQFLSFVINSDLGKRQIDSYLVGGAQQVFNTKTAANFLLSLPTFPEQTAIAEILSDMDAEIAALEAKLVKARQVKQGMMSVLLTGKVRFVESIG